VLLPLSQWQKWRRQGGSDQMLLPLPLVLRSSRLTPVLCP